MRRIAFSVVTTIVLLFSENIAEAGAITYAIENYPADQEGYTLSGTITTDGVIGGLAASDIVSWSWTISYPGEPPVTFSSSDPQSGIFLDGSVVASQSAITIGLPSQPGANFLELYQGVPGSIENAIVYNRLLIAGFPPVNDYDVQHLQLAAGRPIAPAWEVQTPGSSPRPRRSRNPRLSLLRVWRLRGAVVFGGTRNRIRFCRRPAVEARAD